MAHHSSRLFDRYSASQDYYFTRPINDLLDELLTPRTIGFEDQCLYDSEE